MDQLVKRVIRRVVAAGVLGLAILFVRPERAAASEAEVYADAVQLRADESVKIPVYIRNNGGIMGYLLTAEYDSEKIEINDISTGPCFANGLFEHNLSLQQKGRVDILWSHTEEIKEDGILLYFQIRAKKDIGETKTEIRLTYSDEDTFNEKYENVSWNCLPIKIQGGDHAVAGSDRGSDSGNITDSGKQEQDGSPLLRRPENTASKKDAENKDSGSGQLSNGQLSSGKSGVGQLESGQPGSERPGSGGQDEESPGAAGAQPTDRKDTGSSLQREYVEKIMAGAGLAFFVLVFCAPK